MCGRSLWICDESSVIRGAIMLRELQSDHQIGLLHDKGTCSLETLHPDSRYKGLQPLRRFKFLFARAVALRCCFAYFFAAFACFLLAFFRNFCWCLISFLERRAFCWGLMR